MNEHIRNGVGAARPYLYGTEATVAFLEAIGGSVLERVGGHVEVGLQDSVLVVEVRAQWPEAQVRQNVYIYVPDVDAAHRAALGVGATLLAEPAEKPYGERAGAVQDEFGNTYYLATYSSIGPRPSPVRQRSRPWRTR